MRQRIWFLIVVVTMGLAACGGASITGRPEGAATPRIALQKVPASTAAAANTPKPFPTATGPLVSGKPMMPGCTIISSKPTPGPTQEALFPPVTEKDWVIGPMTATVTIIEYSDFQCQTCALLMPILAQITRDFPNDVRYVYRHNPPIADPKQTPDPAHDRAALAAQAAQAAGAQGKFWEMHDLLFARQIEWETLTPEEFQNWLVDQAGKLGLDVTKFTKDLTDPANVAFIRKTQDDNAAIGLTFTPFLLINDQPWTNQSVSYEMLKAVIKLTLLEKRQYTTCPPMVINPQKQYTATIHTSKGDIVLRLFTDQAPLAVNNFVFLARDGWYNGVTFHRVIPGFMAQAGDPTGTGWGGPGYAFQDEISSDLKFDQAGLLAMANSGPDTNGSQFFITYGPASHLDGGFTIFGQVIAGMDVAEKLTPRNPDDGGDLPPGDVILGVDIQEK